MKLLPISFKPLCSQQPKTSSFRIKTTKDDDEMYKTLNSMYFVTESPDWVETPESWFTHSSHSGSPSLTTDVEDELVEHNESHVEAIVRGAQQSSSNNHRLFFDPGETDSPRIQTQTQTTETHTRTRKVENGLMFKESVAMSVDSQDPYEDFKGSMEEMVESLGVRDDWEGLEALLRWYLKVNGKETHRHIINAFVDLVGDVIGNVNYFKRTHYFCSTSGTANVHDHDHDHFHDDNHDVNRDDNDNDDDDNNDDDPQMSNSTTSYSSAASTLSSLGSNNELDHLIC